MHKTKQKMLELELLLVTKARHRMANGGRWMQGDENGANGSHCAIGWIRKVADEEAKGLMVSHTIRDEHERYIFTEQIAEHLVEDDPVVQTAEEYPICSVEEFNDLDSTKKQDVIDLFDRHIERLTTKRAKNKERELVEA